MKLRAVTAKLQGMGFVEESDSAYEPATRFSHWAAPGGSLFVGEGDYVRCSSSVGPTQLPETGPFLVVNGRGRKKGMTKAMLDLDVESTLEVKDRKRLTQNDPLWQGDQVLEKLFRVLPRYFRRKPR